MQKQQRQKIQSLLTKTNGVELSDLVDMTVGEKIQYYREIAGMTQKQLAQKMGITHATLSRYEAGKIKPTVASLAQIASILKITTNKLTDFELALSGLTQNENEKSIIETYRRLNPIGQQRVITYVTDIASMEQYLKKERQNVEGND